MKGIIRRLQEELQELLGKNKVKNGVIVSQEKVLQQTTAELQRVQKDFQSTQETLASKEEQVGFYVLTNITTSSPPPASPYAKKHVALKSTEAEGKYPEKSENSFILWNEVLPKERAAQFMNYVLLYQPIGEKLRVLSLQ